MNRLAVLVIAASAMLLDGAGNTIIIPALPTYAQEFSLGESLAGIFYATFGLVSSLLYLPCGYLVDRIGERRVLTTGLLVLAITMFAYSEAVGFWSLLVCRVMQAVAAGAVWSASIPLAGRFSNFGARGFEMGLVVFFAYGVGITVGPAIGGLGDINAAFRYFAFFPLTLAIFSALLIPDRGTSQIQYFGFSHRDLTGSVLAACLVLLVTYTTVGAIELLVPLSLSELGWTRASIGILFSVRGVISLVAQPIIGIWSDRRSRLEPMWIGLATAGLMIPIFFLFLGSGWEYPLFLLTSIMLMAAAGPTFPLIADRVGEGREGKAFAFSNTSVALGYMVGPWLGGYLAEQVNIVAVASCLAVVLCLTAFATPRLLSAETYGRKKCSGELR